VWGSFIWKEGKTQGRAFFHYLGLHQGKVKEGEKQKKREEGVTTANNMSGCEQREKEGHPTSLV